MKKLSLSVSVILLALGSGVLAADGSDLPACKGVTDVCMAANVTAVDNKTGKTEHGYVAGEHARDGKGLWADCVAPLSKGKQVEGVTGVSADAAKACLAAEHAAHPKKVTK